MRTLRLAVWVELLRHHRRVPEISLWVEVPEALDIGREGMKDVRSPKSSRADHDAFLRTFKRAWRAQAVSADEKCRDATLIRRKAELFEEVALAPQDMIVPALVGVNDQGTFGRKSRGDRFIYF